MRNLHRVLPIVIVIIVLTHSLHEGRITMKKHFAKLLSIVIIFALSVTIASPAIAAEAVNSLESDIQVFSDFTQFASVFPDICNTAVTRSIASAGVSTQTGGYADYTYTITVDPISKAGTF